MDAERIFLKKKRFDEDIWLISRVYTGSSCDLFLAFWPEEDEQVIIKAVKPEVSNEDRSRIEERLLKEASTLEEFWNPSFPKVYDIRRTKDNDQLYLILEHFEGNSLRDYLNIHSEKGLDHSFIEHFTSQMQSSLSYLHTKKKLCHLDLTPENIIVTTDHQVRIIDFEESQVIGQKVKINRVRGKENYLPPEFENPQGSFVHSGASDIYAFGVMLKEVFDKTKGLKSGQKRFYQNIIRNCISKRAEVRPNVSRLMELPPSSFFQDGLYKFQEFFTQKKLSIVVVSVCLLFFAFFYESNLLKQSNSKQTISSQKKVKITKKKLRPMRIKKKSPVKKPVPQVKRKVTKKRYSFTKSLNRSLAKADTKAYECIKSFGRQLNLYRFKVTISPQSGKLKRVLPLNETPRRLIYCINESYSQVSYPKSRSKKEITLIKEFTLRRE